MGLLHILVSLHLKGLREKHSPELSTQIFGEGEGASKAEPAQASPISTFSWHGLGAVRSKLRAPPQLGAGWRSITDLTRSACLGYESCRNGAVLGRREDKSAGVQGWEAQHF